MFNDSVSFNGGTRVEVLIQHFASSCFMLTLDIGYRRPGKLRKRH